MKILSLMVVVVVGLFVPVARGVVNIPYPLSKTYAGSTGILIGNISSIDAEKRVLDVKITETIKGPAAETIRVRMPVLDDFFKTLSAGQMVIVFSPPRRDPNHVIHIGDRWLMAALDNPEVKMWRVTSEKEDLRKSFPGRTVALAEAVKQLKAGKPGLLEAVEDNLFTGGFKPFGKLPVAKAAELRVIDLDNDKSPEWLVSGDQWTRIISRNGDSFEDATGRFSAEGAGRLRAIGDINSDGHVDLVMGSKLYLNDGKKLTVVEMPMVKEGIAGALVKAEANRPARFISLTAQGELHMVEFDAGKSAFGKVSSQRVWADGSTAISAVIGEFGDAGETAVVALFETGLVRFALAASGKGDDFFGLTGEQLSGKWKANGGKFTDARLTSIDTNADGRPDLLITSPTGAMLMVNRGYGAFFPSNRVAEYLANPEAKPAPPTGATTVRSAGNLRGDGFEDFLLLADDGALWRAENPPHGK